MVKSILTHIGGIANYGIISMSLFIFVFVGMLIWTFSLKSSHLKHMAAVACEPETETEPQALNSPKAHE